MHKPKSTRLSKSSKCKSDKRKKYFKKRRHDIKKEVLTRYGKYGELKCCWRGCQVTKLKLLTLDHVDNSGAVFRAVYGRQSTTAYLWAKRYNYPPMFQTLCWNHNYEKEDNRKRKKK